MTLLIEFVQHISPKGGKHNAPVGKTTDESSVNYSAKKQAKANG